MDIIPHTEIEVHHGLSFPLGATVHHDGVNFSVLSRNCESVELWLFNHKDDPEPSHIISFDPEVNKTFYYWHIFLKGIRPGQLYGYKVFGSYEPHNGFFYDGQKLLLDPYGKGVAIPENYSRDAARLPGENSDCAMKSVVVDDFDFDWEGDEHPRHEYATTLIYEMHLGGFTKHPNSGVSEGKAGTYAGLMEKIPYLKELGITAVELLPVQQFDPQDTPNGLPNYWGYTPVSLFAPHTPYSSDQSPLGPVREFKNLVKELHRNNIEVILDVVFNHTAEGGEEGPTFSWRGFENRAYYIVGPDHKYLDYTGCGNTLNANHSVVRRMILDCLHYWVAEMHVDGFRFDLASVLARDEEGHPMINPPILWSIESDPVLADTKIIAEAWDAAGLYQLGSFVGHRWAEWNGKFRDDIRRFLKGDTDLLDKLANRICGSPDLFTSWSNRDPNRSINFVTCHDGFTLNDQVTYNEKHNEVNLENNRDGHDANFSWNGGVEGPSDDPKIERLRIQQIKNFFTLTMISQGTPMISMGDEVRRTQNGNNNAYCQDNELSWFDWSLIEKHAEVFNFVKKLILFHKSHPHFHENQFWINNENPNRVIWHGTHVNKPDWAENSHSLAFTLDGRPDREAIHVMINSFWKRLVFQIPPLPARLGRHWYRALDTGQTPPNDIKEAGKEVEVKTRTYTLKSRSIAVLVAKRV